MNSSLTTFFISVIFFLQGCGDGREDCLEKLDIDIAKVEQEVRAFTRQDGTDCVTLYKMEGGVFCYSSVRIVKNDTVEVQTAEVGKAGRVAYHGYARGVSREDNILIHLKSAIEEGYSMIDEHDFSWIVVEFLALKNNSSKKALELEAKELDRTLVFHGLGRSNAIEGGSSRVLCMVVDYETGKNIIEGRFREYRRLKYVKIIKTTQPSKKQ